MYTPLLWAVTSKWPENKLSAEPKCYVKVERGLERETETETERNTVIYSKGHELSKPCVSDMAHLLTPTILQASSQAFTPAHYTTHHCAATVV